MAGTTLVNIFEDIRSLEEVQQEILSIESSVIINNIPEDILARTHENEVTLHSKWKRSGEISNDIMEFTLPNQIIVRYLVRDTYVETSRRKSNMFGDNQELLPKEQRIIVEMVQTLFFESNNRVYAVLMTTNTTAINKAKKLFGDKIKEIDSDEEISITDYKIDPDLFYWLFYKHEENNGLIETAFEVSSIAGFIGNIADETHTITGTSDVTPSLLVTKAFVSKYHPFKSFDVLLKYNNYKLNFIFNDTSECYIRSSCSIPNLRIEKKIASAIVIYAFIIPHLYSLFNQDQVWGDENTKRDFARDIGKQVIKEIADFHGLNLEDFLN